MHLADTLFERSDIGTRELRSVAKRGHRLGTHAGSLGHVIDCGPSVGEILGQCDQASHSDRASDRSREAENALGKAGQCTLGRRESFSDSGAHGRRDAFEPSHRGLDLGHAFVKRPLFGCDLDVSLTGFDVGCHVLPHRCDRVLEQLGKIGGFGLERRTHKWSLLESHRSGPVLQRVPRTLLKNSLGSDGKPL